MASAPALLLPAVRLATPPAAASGAPARSLPARVHLLLAARRPPRTVSVRCSHKAGGGNPCPGNNVDGPALDALRSAGVDAFRPLMDNFGHIFSMKSVIDVNDYNIGIPFGVAMACIGLHRLFKTDPWTFLDVVLGYAFYKLSVLSSNVDRRGFVNDLITKIKVAIVAVFLIKELPNSNPESLLWVFIKICVFNLYLATFYFGVKGWKEDARHVLHNIFEALGRGFDQILFGPFF